MVLSHRRIPFKWGRLSAIKVQLEEEFVCIFPLFTAEAKLATNLDYVVLLLKGALTVANFTYCGAYHNVTVIG